MYVITIYIERCEVFMILMDGKIVSTNEQTKAITLAEYNALSEGERNDGTSYYITDYDDNEYKKLVKVGNVLGNDAKLSGYADGTVVGAIVDLYSRLNGVSFTVGANDEVTFVYDGTTPTPVEPVPSPDAMTDDEKITHYQEVLGDETALNNLGYANVISAIRDLYARLNGVQLEYNDAESTLKMIYDDNNPK